MHISVKLLLVFTNSTSVIDYAWRLHVLQTNVDPLITLVYATMLTLHVLLGTAFLGDASVNSGAST